MATARTESTAPSAAFCPVIKRDNWFPAFAAVVITAAVLRFYQLGTESLWVDEGFSLRDALTSSDITRLTKPFYYWLLSLWIHFGHSDFFLRVPSAVFGIGAVAMIFVIGRMIWNTKAATIAGLLAAVAPMQVDHSQEVRMYSLVMLLVLLSAYFMILALRTWRLRYMAACGVFIYLAMLTMPLAVIMLFAFNAAVLDRYVKQRMSLLPWLAVMAVVVAYWTPLLPFVMGFHEGYQGQATTRMLDTTTLFDVPALWCKFVAGQWSKGTRLMPGYHVYTLLVLSMMAAAVWSNRKDLLTRFIAAWLVIPLAVMLIVFSNRGDSWYPRHVLFISGSVFLLIGAACSRIKNRMVYALVLAFIFTFPALKLYRYYAETDRADWRSATNYLTLHQKPDDMIAVYRNSAEWVFRHYYNGRAHWMLMHARYFLPDSQDEYKEWTPEKAARLLDKIPKRKRRWLAVSRVPGGAKKAIDTAIRSNYRVIDYKEFEDVRLYLFTAK